MGPVTSCLNQNNPFLPSGPCLFWCRCYVTGPIVCRGCIDLHYSNNGDQWDDVACDVMSKPKQDEHAYRRAENVTAPSPQFWKQGSHTVYSWSSFLSCLTFKFWVMEHTLSLMSRMEGKVITSTFCPIRVFKVTLILPAWGIFSTGEQFPNTFMALKGWVT